MTIVTGDNTATSAASGAGEDAVERALAAAVRDISKVGGLLEELSRGRLWVPLPDDGRAVTDGSAVTLPTVTYLGSDFVPAFTSAGRLQQSAPEPEEGRAAPLIPHVVVRAADLARLLPASLGIALNPGAGESVPVYPEGVAYLASARKTDPATRISVGPLPAQPDGLFAGIRAGLLEVPAARDAAAAWLSVEFAGEGLIISVTLDDPQDETVQEMVIRVVERAAQAAPQDAGFPIDVTFPGEGEPDPVDEWVAAFAIPFYRRS
jgi:hypothetical protein